MAAGGFLTVGSLAAISAFLAADQIVVGDLTLLVAVAVYLVVGALLVARRPSERIGWIFAASAALMLVGGWALNYSTAVLGSGEPMTPLPAAALWVSAWFWPVAFAGLTTFTFLLFPTGHPPTRRWGLVGWAAAVGALGSGLVYSFAETICGGSDAACDAGTAITVQNPVGFIADVTAEAIGSPFFALEMLAGLVALASLVVRYRRSRGTERAQLKWFTFAAALLVVLLVLGSLLDAVDLAAEQRALPVVAVALSLIPASVAIALFRYRLYEIDRIINRTLVYGSVVGLLLAGYAGAVVMLQLVLPERNDLAVAASTLAVAALFNPLRRRVQRFVDRRFYRSRYDAARVVAELSARLQDEVDVEALTADWVGVVQETMQPSSVSVWMREQA